MPVTVNTEIVTSNMAAGVLLSGVSALDTTLTLAAGQGAFFPNPSATQAAVIVIQEGGFWEICHITARAGDVLSVRRAQEGTLARNFNPGSVVEQRVTAGLIANMQIRIRELEQEALRASFEGEIRAWSGYISDIPNLGGHGSNTWRLCDGTNNTPDLVNKFIMGAGGATPSFTTGGAAQWVGKVARALGGALRTAGHVLTGGQMPWHGHNAIVYDPGHYHAWPGLGGSVLVTGGGDGTVQWGGNQTPLQYKGFELSPSGTNIAVGIEGAGGDQAHDHALPALEHDHDVTVPTLPPYLTLAFIRRMK